MPKFGDVLRQSDAYVKNYSALSYVSERRAMYVGCGEDYHILVWLVCERPEIGDTRRWPIDNEADWPLEQAWVPVDD